MMKKLEKNIWILYLTLLPVTFYNPFKDILFSLSNSISFYFHIILCFFILINTKKFKYNKFIKYLASIIFLLNILSVIMAITLHNNLGEWLNRTTYIAIIPYLLYYIQIFIGIYVNYFYYKKFGLEIINKCLKYICIWNLVLGYIQVFIIITDINFIELIYKNIVEKFTDFSYVISYNRVCLATPEASLAGALLSILILPYIFSKILKYRSKKYLLLLILYLPIIFYMESSSIYLSFFANIFAYWILAFKNKTNIKFIFTSGYIISITLLIFIVLEGNNLINIRSNQAVNKIIYLVTDKIYSNNDLSTLHRSTSIYTNLEAFKRYPFIGVGNGNQGFFYRRYFPEWGFYSEEATRYYYGYSGWPGGGAFLSSYISAYGIVGLIFLIIFLVLSYHNINNNMNKLELNYMYKIGMISLLISSITTIDIIGNYYIIFLISIPAFD